jgi:cyclic pyranopterin phosphate synthase
VRIRNYFYPFLAGFFRQFPELRQWAIKTDTRLGRLKHSAAEYFPQLIAPEPRHLTIAITARCNLLCLGCRYGRDFMPNQQLSWPLVRNLLDDSKAIGFELVRLYGGEPLLHPDLPKMIQHSIKLGMATYVTTNGTLLKEKIDELYGAGLRNLTIGFYGTGEEYDSYVQRRNRFSRLETGIAAARDRYGDKISLRLNWLLRRQSCSVTALHETVDFAVKYRMPIQVDLIHYSLPYFTEGADKVLQFRPEDREQIGIVVAELVRLKGAHPQLFDQNIEGLRSIPDWLLKGSNMRVPCDKYQMIWVGADGTVQLCYVTFRLGNLHEQRLSELMFTPQHYTAARGAFALRCPNCHCGYDSRIQKHAPSLRKYSP